MPSLFVFRPQPRRHPLAHAALLACVLSAAMPAAQAQPSAAQSSTAAARHDYDIPPGPLAPALRRAASQAGVVLGFTPAQTDGKRTAGLRGSHTAGEALSALLAGSGLALVRTDAGTYVLQAAPAAAGPAPTGTLREVTVKAQAESSAATEGTGSYVTGVMGAATKMALSARETPQSVSVITRQRMEDQSMDTLNDVVRNTTGLTLTKWGDERPRYNARGFQLSNLMVDGLPVFYEEAALSSGLLSQYDRVEIVRGASGLMEGAGSPGGSINLVRKRPTREFQGSVTAGAGSWDNYSGSLDVGGPLNEQGTLRGRGVLSYQDKNAFQDYRENQRTLLYGILEADIAPATTLSLGASYSKENNPGANWVGMGTYPDGSFLPIARSHSMSPAWTYWNKQSKTVFADLSHRLANDWTAKLAATYVQSDMNMLGVSFYREEDLRMYNVGSYDYDIAQKSLDAMLSGPFSLLGRQHELVLGASHRVKQDDWTGSWPADYRFAVDPLDAASAGTAPYPQLQTPNPYGLKGQIEQSSVYSTARFQLRDDLKLIAGGRLDWYAYEQDIRSGSWTNSTRYKATREFTPYLGLVYDIDHQYSAYASMTRIFNPQNYQKPGGALIEPQQGSNYELGIKGAYLDGKLNASLALFQINLDSLPVELSASECSPGQQGCYGTSGQVRSRGIELELSGELARGWQMGAGYTYNYVENLEPSTYSPIGTGISGKRFGTNLPLNLLKLYTSYRLPGEWRNWKIGGGVQTQSKVYTQYGVKQGGYTLVDLQLGYAVNRNLDLSLSIHNVFDKHYYAGILSIDSGNFLGDPRNVMLTARMKF